MRGRPKLPDEDRRTNILRIRLTPNERMALEKFANGTKKDISTWARETLLDLAKGCKS